MRDPYKKMKDRKDRKENMCVPSHEGTQIIDYGRPWYRAHGTAQHLRTLLDVNAFLIRFPNPDTGNCSNFSQDRKFGTGFLIQERVMV